MQENSFYKNNFPDINYLIINTKPINFYNPRTIPFLDLSKETSFNNFNNEICVSISFEKFINNSLFKGILFIS